jgi:hypothetical protein
LRQRLHAISHDVAQSIRNLDQFYAQYQAFRNVREAARINLDRQLDFFRAGGIPTERVTYINVLLAVTDWGNAVSNEANSLALYNIELASLRQQIGTILEDHGIRFYEEYYASRGPLCELQCYGESMWTSENQPQYELGDEPSEESFDLESRVPRSGRRKGAVDESEEDRARRLRESLPPPRRIESLPPPERAPTQPAVPGARPEQPPPAEPPPEPPEEGRIPGDDLRELLDRLKDLPNPFKGPEKE